MRDHPHHDRAPVGEAAPDQACSRRAALRLAGGLGVAAFATLAGCGGQKRTQAIGAPIPPDPVLRHPSGSSPVPRTSYPTRTIPSAGAPRVELRSQWAKGGPKTWLADRMSGISRITVHHDGIHPAPSTDYGACAARLESIRRGHLGHGWADIGYHYSIDPAGRIWEARPLDLQGAHVKNQNPHNLGIMLMGNFERTTPTMQAQASLRQLLAWNMGLYGVRISNVVTHRELAPTACPGRNLQSIMNGVRTGGSLARV
ncbi:MAG: hypothetical protein DHS20C14_17250 [Phycisphaeraceae bacterium]|nr:MAG: hypothetical protein DHS20C14_17250 [Phycisphaeraceae bacterium]